MVVWATGRASRRKRQTGFGRARDSGRIVLLIHGHEGLSLSECLLCAGKELQAHPSSLTI